MLRTPSWLKRLSTAWFPNSIRLLGDVLPVAVVQMDPGPFSRLPLSRALFFTAIYSAIAGENGIVQLKPRRGYELQVLWVGNSAASRLNFGVSDLTGTLTGEADATELWADDTFAGGEAGADFIVGTLATGGLPVERIVSLPSTSNMPFAFGTGPLIGVPWCRIREAEVLHINNPSPNTAGVTNVMVQVVRV